MIHHRAVPRPLFALAVGALLALSPACSKPKPAEPQASPPVAAEEPGAVVVVGGEEEEIEAPASQPASQPADVAERAVSPSKAQADRRAEDALRRLDASPAGQTIARAIEAHGGLAHWYAQGPLKFRFTYEPLDPQKTKRDTVQIVDTWSARARHTSPDDPSTQFGWDGQRAWTTDEALEITPRFWALTPYYFVAVPFVFADEGVHLERAGEQVFEEKTYEVIKVTFGEGVGDAPEDYYMVYVDRQSGRVGGVRYIVSYPGFFPEGGHTPEKWMAYDGVQEVDGIKFPQTFRTFAWDEKAQAAGELVTRTSLTEVSFEPATKASFFDMPEGATAIDTL